ncbi:sulfurtransferase, partial [Stenotrophomonas sp. 278]
MTLSANFTPLIDAATLAAMLGQDTPRLLDARATAS